jgi:hypothetical protein
MFNTGWEAEEREREKTMVTLGNGSFTDNILGNI